LRWGFFCFPWAFQTGGPFLLTITKEAIMSNDLWEFITACQRAQDEAYGAGDFELAISWSEHILEALK
jgi:hypothetical protein